jgi:hypothetical protein
MDDDDVEREFMRRVLEARGFHVATTATAGRPDWLGLQFDAILLRGIRAIPSQIRNTRFSGQVLVLSNANSRFEGTTRVQFPLRYPALEVAILQAIRAAWSIWPMDDPYAAGLDERVLSRSLKGVELRIARLLLRARGNIVSRATLQTEGIRAATNSLNVHIHRLARKFALLGIGIHTEWNEGYAVRL